MSGFLSYLFDVFKFFPSVCMGALFAVAVLGIRTVQRLWVRQFFFGAVICLTAFSSFWGAHGGGFFFDIRPVVLIIAAAFSGVPGGFSALVTVSFLQVMGNEEHLYLSIFGAGLSVLFGLLMRPWLHVSAPLKNVPLLLFVGTFASCAFFLLGGGVSLSDFAHASERFCALFLSYSLVTAFLGVIVGGMLYQQNLLERALRAEAEARKSDQEKSEFLARVSHELRTPVAVIVGYLELFKNRDLPQGFVQGFDAIVRASRALSMLIEDLLDVARSEQGLLHVQRCYFSPRALVQDLVELFAALAHEKGLVLEGCCAEDVPDLLVGDEGRIRQILFNVVGNAVKYTQIGEVRLFACMKKQCFAVFVKDTGIGMEKHEITRMFMPHVQDPRGAAYSRGGLGLGLAISRQLASTLGGTLTAESELGKGTEFCLSVPVTIAEKSMVHKKGQAGVLRENALLGYHILVAEDTFSLRQLTQQVLQDAGATVKGVSNGREALSALNECSFDVVLMDMGMPIMDGVQATKTIRNAQKSWSHVPIIALTADAVCAHRGHYDGIGLSAFMTKPVSWSTLIEQITRFPCALRKQDAQEESTQQEEQPMVEVDKEEAPVDFTVQKELRDTLGDKAFEALLTTCWEDTDRVLSELVDSQEDDVRARQLEAAHKLKGIALNFGYPKLAHLAARLEISAKTENVGGSSIEEILEAARSARRLTIKEEDDPRAA